MSNETIMNVLREAWFSAWTPKYKTNKNGVRSTKIPASKVKSGEYSAYVMKSAKKASATIRSAEGEYRDKLNGIRRNAEGKITHRHGKPVSVKEATADVSYTNSQKSAAAKENKKMKDNKNAFGKSAGGSNADIMETWKSSSLAKSKNGPDWTKGYRDSKGVYHPSQKKSDLPKPGPKKGKPFVKESNLDKQGSTLDKAFLQDTKVKRKTMSIVKNGNSITKTTTNEGLDEVAPPGREKQVKELKKKFPKSSAFAIAWASYNKSHPKEETQIDELSKNTLKDYVSKAGTDLERRLNFTAKHGGEPAKDKKFFKRSQNRARGIKLAAKKFVTKEETQWNLIKGILSEAARAKGKAGAKGQDTEGDSHPINIARKAIGLGLPVTLHHHDKSRTHITPQLGHHIMAKYDSHVKPADKEEMVHHLWASDKHLAGYMTGKKLTPAKTGPWKPGDPIPEKSKKHLAKAGVGKK